MRNLGPKSTKWLAEVHLDSRERLAQAGAIVAYLSVKQRHSEASLNLLWAIYGAIHDIDWREIPEETKAELRRTVDSHLR